jgi:hypothetical protein
MAALWEEYQFSKLRFCYETRTGSNTPGSVIQAIDYDAADAAPTSEQVISSYQGAVEGAPWLPQICCDARGSSLSGFTKRRYLRTAALAANQDIKTYDVGNFFLAIVDGTAVGWGKLYVEYDVTFFIPQLPANGPLVILGGNIVGGGGGLSGANPFGNVPVPDPQSAGISMDGTSTLTLATPGTYLVVYDVVGTGITAIAAPVLVGCTVINAGGFYDSGGFQATVILGITSTIANASILQAFTATTVTASDVFVGMVPVGSIS